MNHKLLKELEQAGFPLSRVTDKDLPDGEMFISNTPHYAVPTLSELIEECGKGFYSMVRVRDGDWRCYTEDEKFFPKEGGTGTMPEEAVSRLWLSLQKNKALPPKQETTN